VIKLVKLQHCTATEPTSNVAQRSEVFIGVGAGTARTRDKQFT